MFKLVMAILIALALTACGEESAQTTLAPEKVVQNSPFPSKETATWCEYFHLSDKKYADYEHKWYASHKNREMTDAEHDQMSKQIRRELISDSDRIFGKITDDQFLKIQWRANSGSWENYCTSNLNK